MGSGEPVRLVLHYDIRHRGWSEQEHILAIFDCYRAHVRLRAGRTRHDYFTLLWRMDNHTDCPERMYDPFIYRVTTDVDLHSMRGTTAVTDIPCL